MNEYCGKLTRYSEGSIRELWAISFPLILSVLSMNLMIFLSRLILAKYDIKAMNSAFIAWFIFSIFQYGAMGIASIAEAFVGQFNGAKQYQKIGQPVWQMIWFSIFSGLVFIPAGLFAGPILISNPDYAIEGIPFFKVLMLFGPAFPMVTALSSFFVGRGQVKLVMVTTIIINVINIFLSFIFIFGVQNFFPAMGTKGAAIATGVKK